MKRLALSIGFTSLAAVLVVSFQQCSPASFSSEHTAVGVNSLSSTSQPEPGASPAPSPTPDPSLPPTQCLPPVVAQIKKDCKDKSDVDDDRTVKKSVASTGVKDKDDDDDLDDDDGKEAVQICHVPPGNPAAKHTIVISKSAVETHLSHHGDYLGTCEQAAPVDCQ